MHSDAIILAGAAHRPAIFRKNQCIFRQGDQADAIWRVDRGCVRLQIIREDGRREVFAFLFPGDLFPGVSGTHWASAEAVTESVVSRFPTASLRQLIGSDPEAALTLLGLANHSLLELAQHLGRISQASADERVRWFLDWLAARTSTPGSGAAHLPMSRRDIADFLGLAPETVSRLLRQLEAKGHFQRTDRRRYLLSPGPHRPTPGAAATPQAA